MSRRANVEIRKTQCDGSE
jgi:hypothetical protein